MPLLSPGTLRKKLPISAENEAFIQKSREDIQKILDGQDPRILLILGPCSIHDPTSALEFATRVKELSTHISDLFYPVMRVYLEKSRTSTGWKGYAFDPDLNGTCDIEKGLTLSRKLLLDLTELQVPLATEFLDTATTYYLQDLISWGCIGARTTTSQVHRQIASSLPMPIGFKNSTDGNVQLAIDGILAAAQSHSYIGLNEDGQASIINSKGNPEGHLVLRGGSSGPNYSKESIQNTLKLLREHDLPSRVIIDCSHDNASRLHEKQINVFNSAIEQIIEGNSAIKGLLLESHLHAGKQPLPAFQYGISITDPCLDFDTTEKLIKWGYKQCEKELTHLLG